MSTLPDDRQESRADHRFAKSVKKSRAAGDDQNQVIADLKDRLKFHNLISGISARFVILPPGKVDAEIENGLKFILDYMGLDRCTFAEFSEDRKNLYVTHSYHHPDIDQTISGQVSDSYPWLASTLVQGKVFAMERPSDLPAEAVKEKAYIQRSGLKSILAIPVSVGGSLICTIAFTAFKKYISWPEYTIEQLTLLGEVFANALFRMRAGLEIEKHIGNLNKQVAFEKLISDISARFIDHRTLQVEKQIEDSLHLLVEYLGMDRGTFLQISKNRTELIPVQAFAVEGVEKVGIIPLASWYPWACVKLLKGEVVAFSSEDELPPEADEDRINLPKLGLKSILLVPLYVDDKVNYALGVGTVRKARKVPQDIAPRLKLVGEIFVNALMRSGYIETMVKKDKELKVAYKKISAISEQLAQENRYYKTEISESLHSRKIVGISGGLNYIFYRLKQVAPADTTVLIEGETGTGKELIARALHENSKRKDKPLIKIDCTTLHGNVIESELFGHEKGSFTGASDQHIGRIELADEATVFLDEVGELPLALQASLLRVIEDGEFERVGGSRTFKVNIRLIAATNRNLLEEIKKGNFRQDLFYRLSVFPLSLPPLRERKEDIPLLADWFVQRFNKQLNKKVTKIPAAVLKELQAYTWPGNVRELENVIERAMITSEDSVLKLMDILRVEHPINASSVSGLSLEEMERNYILSVLKNTYWRIEGKNGAAIRLGLHPDTLRSRMKKHGIHRPSANK